MADTMNFGPQWLRTLVDGSQAGSGPSPATPSTKFKLAEHRYGREELLNFFQSPYEPPGFIVKFPHIYVGETQTPMAFIPYTEEEERLYVHGVNSQSVIRPSRSGSGSLVPLRVARPGSNAMVDRGRGRGKGRGETYIRGGLENGDMGGGFHRSRGPNKDGWEEVGHRKIERGFSRPFEEAGREGHPRFNRSMSDNWRERGPADDDDEGDWRKPTRDRWTTRSSWREPGRGGHDLEPRRGDREGGYPRSRGLEADDRGRRLDVPEWIDDGTEDVGSFDASGAFVSNREPPYYIGSKEHRDDHGSRDHQHMDKERPEGGSSHSQQQRREPDGWESSDSGPELGSRGPPPAPNPSTASPQAAGSSNSSREDAGPPVGKREEETPAEALNTVESPADLRAGDAREPFPPPTVASEAQAEESVGAPPALTVNTTAPQSMEDEMFQKVPVVPVSHENAWKWYYVDPQDNLQGPFSSEDMGLWFNAGYFTMCLKVKRGCDHDFQPLGDLMKQWGQIPFLASSAHPPIVKSIRSTASPSEPASVTQTLSLTTPAPTPTPTPNPTPSNPHLPTAPAPHPALSLAAAAGGVAGVTPPSALPTLPLSSSSSLPLGVGAPGTGPTSSPEAMLIQQQLIIQHQILQQQVEYRQLQMQTLSQLQEQEDFKALDPAQQQQLSLHYMHNNPALQQCLQNLQQLQAMLQQTQQTQQQLQLLAASKPSSVPSQPQPGGSAAAAAGSGGGGGGSGLGTTVAGSVGMTAAVPPPVLPPSVSVSSITAQSLHLQQQHPMPSVADISTSSSSTKFHLPPVSQPTSTGPAEGQREIPSIWGSGPPAGGQWPLGQPTSVWELENSLSPADVNKSMELETIRKKEEHARKVEAERKRQEEIQKQNELLRREAEALQRERERMEREQDELEKQRIRELQRVEELRRQQEEEQQRREREEEQRRKQQLEEEKEQRRKQQADQQRRREEEAAQRKREEAQRRKEQEDRRKEEQKKEEQKKEEEEWNRQQEELRRQRETELIALQEMKRMEEARQQQEAEKARQREIEKKQEAEAAAQKKKDLERQQQEALRRLQQQQNLKNIQLPSSANWARQQQGAQSVQSRSLAEIQQEEEKRQAQQERERQQQLQRQQQEQQLLQNQMQQQQKTWASNLAAQQPPRVKTLAEIQEEQERQLKQEKQKTQQQQSYQAKTMSLAQAAAWPSSSPFSTSPPPSSSPTAAAVEGAAAPSTQTGHAGNPWSNSGGSLWSSTAPASIWGSSNPTPTHSQKSSGKKSAKENQGSAEFPSLHSQQTRSAKQSSAKASSSNSSASSKPKKEEAAVQRIFKEREQNKDEFTMWCEATLQGMEVQVDIETFVSFLREVDSPYEIHDYVKNYLGEGGKARQFAKDFLTKRSQLNDKARKEKQQEEESIWGPAPALNPREIRGNAVQTSNADHGGGFTEVGGGKSKGGKKKKKMQKLDNASLLGFTVAKDPNRKNAGEIETID